MRLRSAEFTKQLHDFWAALYTSVINYIVAYLLKARIVNPTGTAVTRERYCKHARC
jgi:uncharacterized paraquat-inducible protein A